MPRSIPCRGSEGNYTRYQVPFSPRQGLSSGMGMILIRRGSGTGREATMPATTIMEMSYSCWAAAISIVVEYPSESSSYNNNDGDARNKGPNQYLVIAEYLCISLFVPGSCKDTASINSCNEQQWYAEV